MTMTQQHELRDKKQKNCVTASVAAQNALREAVKAAHRRLWTARKPHYKHDSLKI
jgi:hypothetical protein